MAQYNMLDEHPGRLFSSNVATGLLVRGKDPSLGHMAAHQINTPKLEAWKVLPEAVKTGQTAFVLAHNGETMYQVYLLMNTYIYGFSFCKVIDADGIALIQPHLWLGMCWYGTRWNCACG